MKMNIKWERIDGSSDLQMVIEAEEQGLEVLRDIGNRLSKHFSEYTTPLKASPPLDQPKYELEHGADKKAILRIKVSALKKRRSLLSKKYDSYPNIRTAFFLNNFLYTYIKLYLTCISQKATTFAAIQTADLGKAIKEAWKDTQNKKPRDTYQKKAKANTADDTPIDYLNAFSKVITTNADKVEHIPSPTSIQQEVFDEKQVERSVSARSISSQQEYSQSRYSPENSRNNSRDVSRNNSPSHSRNNSTQQFDEFAGSSILSAVPLSDDTDKTASVAVTDEKVTDAPEDQTKKLMLGEEKISVLDQKLTIVEYFEKIPNPAIDVEHVVNIVLSLHRYYKLKKEGKLPRGDIHAFNNMDRNYQQIHQLLQDKKRAGYLRGPVCEKLTRGEIFKFIEEILAPAPQTPVHSPHLRPASPRSRTAADAAKSENMLPIMSCEKKIPTLDGRELTILELFISLSSNIISSDDVVFLMLVIAKYGRLIHQRTAKTNAVYQQLMVILKQPTTVAYLKDKLHIHNILKYRGLDAESEEYQFFQGILDLPDLECKEEINGEYTFCTQPLTAQQIDLFEKAIRLRVIVDCIIAQNEQGRSVLRIKGDAAQGNLIITKCNEIQKNTVSNPKWLDTIEQAATHELNTDARLGEVITYLMLGEQSIKDYFDGFVKDLANPNIEGVVDLIAVLHSYEFFVTSKKITSATENFAIIDNAYTRVMEHLQQQKEFFKKNRGPIIQALNKRNYLQTNINGIQKIIEKIAPSAAHPKPSGAVKQKHKSSSLSNIGSRFSFTFSTARPRPDSLDGPTTAEHKAPSSSSSSASGDSTDMAVDDDVLGNGTIHLKIF